MDREHTHEIDQLHAWRYFELHAKQRMAVFNFFLVLSGLILAGLSSTFDASSDKNMFGIALAILLILVSFIFWKLDQRTSFLIKHAEKALATSEADLNGDRAKLFATEPDETEKNKSGNWWQRHWTFGELFRTVFIAMGAIGIFFLLIFFLRMSATDSSAPPYPRSSFTLQINQ